jgi:hypothetical protein
MLFIACDLADHIREDEVDETCRRHGGTINAYEILVGRYEIKRRIFLGVDERLLKWFSRK